MPPRPDLSRPEAKVLCKKVVWGWSNWADGCILSMRLIRDGVVHWGEGLGGLLVNQPSHQGGTTKEVEEKSTHKRSARGPWSWLGWPWDYWWEKTTCASVDDVVHEEEGVVVTCYVRRTCTTQVMTQVRLSHNTYVASLFPRLRHHYYPRSYITSCI